jgi:hypothetical protein
MVSTLVLPMKAEHLPPGSPVCHLYSAGHVRVALFVACLTPIALRGLDTPGTAHNGFSSGLSLIGLSPTSNPQIIPGRAIVHFDSLTLGAPVITSCFFSVCEIAAFIFAALVCQVKQSSDSALWTKKMPWLIRDCGQTLIPAGRAHATAPRF